MESWDSLSCPVCHDPAAGAALTQGILLVTGPQLSSGETTPLCFPCSRHLTCQHASVSSGGPGCACRQTHRNCVSCAWLTTAASATTSVGASSTTERSQIPEERHWLGCRIFALRDGVRLCSMAFPVRRSLVVGARVRASNPAWDTRHPGERTSHQLQSHGAGTNNSDQRSALPAARSIVDSRSRVGFQHGGLYLRQPAQCSDVIGGTDAADRYNRTIESPGRHGRAFPTSTAGPQRQFMSNTAVILRVLFDAQTAATMFNTLFTS